MKKLFRVVAETEFFFLADDGKEPSHEAMEEALEQAVDDCVLLYDFSPVPVDSLEEVGEDDRKSLPYGTKDARTIEELFAETKR